jgi:hypothetical protein
MNQATLILVDEGGAEVVRGAWGDDPGKSDPLDLPVDSEVWGFIVLDENGRVHKSGPFSYNHSVRAPTPGFSVTLTLETPL